MNLDFSRSNKKLQEVLKVIPLASQTFSKSHIQYPEHFSPQFIDRGIGSKVWDIDGNQFIDLVSGLMSNVLGYNDKDVNNAILLQLNKGITFSLPSDLEYQLAQKLVEIIPCAEMARFAKTGTDVTSAAIRLARAYTKRDKVLVCGYHGWQDWYIGTTTRNAGVPDSVSILTTRFDYNDLEQLKSFLKTEEYAAVIMEPTNIVKPTQGYLSGVRALTEQYGSLLVFDEMVTGFHFALGGAQAYFDVTPDLACFGKGMGNGMPISALVGKKKFMRLMDAIFFSGTFGGEALSLAAAIAVIQKMQNEPVIEQLWQFGKGLANKVQGLIETHRLNNIIKLKGYSPWKFLSFSDADKLRKNVIKTYFQKEMISQGILILASHNISYSMNEDDMSKIVSAYNYTFRKLSYDLEKGTVEQSLVCPTIEPIFSVR